MAYTGYTPVHEPSDNSKNYYEVEKYNNIIIDIYLDR